MRGVEGVSASITAPLRLFTGSMTLFLGRFSNSRIQISRKFSKNELLGFTEYTSSYFVIISKNQTSLRLGGKYPQVSKMSLR